MQCSCTKKRSFLCLGMSWGNRGAWGDGGGMLRGSGGIKNLKASEVANCRCTSGVKRADDVSIDGDGARLPGYFIPRGKFSCALKNDEDKARAFESALGYTEGNWQDLALEMLE